MFDTIQAQQVLAKVHEILLGPLGMKTLDPKDWAYRPDYLNQVDSEDRSTSKGFNYHQGPVIADSTVSFQYSYICRNGFGQ